MSRTARAVLLVVLPALLLLGPPAAAESECLSDPAGDVVDRSGPRVAERPEADVLAACWDHRATELEIAVRVAAPTDPAADPAWAGFGSAVGAAIDTDGDGTEDVDANLGRFDDGAVRTGVFDHDSGALLCDAPGSFDGVRYRMVIPRSCLGEPSEVAVAAFVVYQSDLQSQRTTGFFDEVPAAPGFAAPVDTAEDPATGAVRLAGLSRIDTAVAVSQDEFGDGGAEAVVLARADVFPDALVGAPLAVAVGGPLLLTPSDALVDPVRSELARVLEPGRTVYLSGGENAISAAVRTQLEELGYVVERLSGLSRYETAVRVAEAAQEDPDLIVVADGNTFPDALVGGSLAAFEGGVEVLSNGTSLDPSAAAYLDAHPDAEVVAVGATAAQAVPDAQAIVGDDAFETAAMVAAARYPQSSGVAIASGTNFPDGLAGGAHAARAGVPLLLSWPDVLPGAVVEHLGDAGSLDLVVLYGGEVALSHQVEADAAASLG
jgi:hypothetical protein